MKRLLLLFIVLALPCGVVFSQKKDTYRVRTVVIDPGHGGAKPGAQGSRTKEKIITLSVAKKFGKLIEDNYPDVKVIYTRTTDVDISLGERARIANRNKADLFISIHANSHPTSTPTGVETFVMGLSESRANLEVAKKENADILLEADYKTNADYSGFDPNTPESYVMLAMFQNDFIDKSLNFAGAIQSQYRQNLKTINRGVKQAELFVLYKTTCPSVLTEIGFISNPNEEAFMMSDEGQAKIAVCLFNAFMNYKATEEGTNKIVNPKIDLPGYNTTTPAKPEVVEQAPAVVEQKPVVVEQKPVVVEQKPVEVEQKPVVVEQKPVVVEQKPVVVEQKPVVEVATVVVDDMLEPVPEVAAAPEEKKPLPAVELPAKVEPQPVPAPAPKPEPKVEPAPEPKPTPAPTPATARTLKAPVHTASSNDQFYTVQFLTAPAAIAQGDERLQGVTDFEVIRKGNLYCCITGRFATFKEASDYCYHIHEVTPFKDAWAFLYRRPAEAVAEVAKPEAAPVQQQAKPEATPAQQQAKPAKPSPAATKVVKDLTYRVQFCSSYKEMKVGDPDLKGIKDFRYSQQGKFYVYTAGNYATLAEAEKRCAEIKKIRAFKDAFVIAIYKGERITLEQARAMK